jgi:hypothetical protein
MGLEKYEGLGEAMDTCKCDWCGVYDESSYKTGSGDWVCYMCYQSYTS